MSYFNVFGGDPIFPAKMSRRAIALNSNITLAWAAEGSSQAIADIIDVTPSGPGLSITLPDARKASPGVATLIANLGADTVSIRDAGGAEVAAVDPGSSWQIYLRTNTTLAGTWGVGGGARRHGHAGDFQHAKHRDRDAGVLYGLHDRPL